MRKQRAADISDIALPRRAQSRMVQSAGRSSKSASHLLLHQKLLPPGPPRSAVGSNGNAKTSQFCISSSSMGIRKLPSKILLISKGRFGKRPPSFTTEYIGPAIDSEDSGFGCDFHSSESQPSWCTTDDSTNKSSSVQQPIFSLSSRTLSSSNLSISSQISTSSSASSSPTSVTSFTVPQFSTSSPEKQFLANLLHESLAQEDAIDQFDGPYYTIANSTGAPTSTSTTPPLSDPVPVPVSTSSSSSPQRIAQESINQAGKVLLIVPSTTSNNSQPLNFTQVFGKLSPTEIVNNTLLSQYLNGSAAGAISNVSTQQPKQEQQQQFGYDSTVIKIEQELNTNSTMKLPPELINNEESSSFRVVNPTSINDNFSKPLSPPVVNNSNIVSPIQSHCSLNTLKDILIESSREAVELDDSVRENERKQNSSEGDQAAAVVAEVARYDPMVILSQAVTLQKELYEEPALDGIPINGKRANISGFGFAKGINTTASTNTTLNGLIVDSLPTSSLPASTLVSVVPQQTQQVLDSQQPLKLMQLTENVRMSPDSTQTGVTVSSSTLPFSSHQVTRQITTSTPVITQMGTNPTSPTSTTSNPSPSPIPVKRSRFSFAHPAASKISGLKLRNQNQNQNYMPARSVGKRLPPGTTPTLTSNLAPYTRDGRAQLQIVSQPEEQHRARYQTEGSRGAIKDRKGNGFPTVKLVGYDKPATLQIFIGSDQGKISPHMFYQACKVTGKSSTPCIEKKVEGTILIEIEFEPSKEMVISCDCVGILKERNVDVEQRFPFHHASQSRKKSTKCRMIYRTTVINSDGMEETLQVASLPILCTQPPGVPEICKQSLTECPARGGLELFVVGKNFLKDTRVVFQQEDTEGNAVWETSSEPLKDYLQQNHLICPVPAFKEEKIVEPVECKVLVVSGGKHSEPHRFTYLPELVNAHIGVPPALSNCVSNSQNQQQASPVIQAALVQQIQNASGLLPVEMQAVSTLMPAREGLVKSVIVSSPNEGCSPISITSSDGSMCSPGSLEVQNFSQPSTPVTTTAMNPLSTLGFSSVPLLQTAPPPENPAVSTFQSVLQQAVAQQQQQNQQAENQAVSNFQTVLQQAVAAQQQQQNQQAESQAVSNFQSVLQQAVVQQQQQSQQAESPAVTTFQSVLQQAVVAQQQQQQQQQNQQAENPAVSTFQSVLQQAVVAQQQQQNQQAESPAVSTFQSVLQQAVVAQQQQQNQQAESPAVSTFQSVLQQAVVAQQQQQNQQAESPAVTTFQSVLQQAVVAQQQQAESKAVAVAALMKNASDLLESMKPPTTTTFSGMGLPEQKPVVTNTIPLDLQFPTQDLPAVTTTPQVQMNTTSTVPTTQLSTFVVPETVPITTINNPFQQNQQQMSLVTMPQIMNGVSGIGMSGSMPSTTTAPTVLASAVQPNPQTPPRTTMNEVVMASVNPAASVTVSNLSVAECMGQTIIKTEPVATINNDLRLTMGNNGVSVAVASSHPRNPQQPGVMGMMGGELQPHQGSLANALSQMSDNELINYINPNCFEGPLP